MTGSKVVAGPVGEDTPAADEPAIDGGQEAVMWEMFGEFTVPVLTASEALLAARFRRISEPGD